MQQFSTAKLCPEEYRIAVSVGLAAVQHARRECQRALHEADMVRAEIEGAEIARLEQQEYEAGL